MSAAVSIIVPCYNVAPYLDKCMESLTLQTLGDLEIISVMTVPGTIPQPSCAHGLKGMAASGWWTGKTAAFLRRAIPAWPWLAGNISALWTRMITWNTPCMAACWKKPAGVMRM